MMRTPKFKIQKYQRSKISISDRKDTRRFETNSNTHVFEKLYLCTSTCKNQTVIQYQGKIIFEMNMISKATLSNTFSIGCNSIKYQFYSCDHGQCPTAI